MLALAAIASETRHHQVQKGETLYSISRQYGLKVTDLTAANPVLKSKPLRSGQKLIIPEKGAVKADPPLWKPPLPKETPSTKSAPEPAATGSIHVIQEGETLYGLARRYGVTVSQLQKANPHKNPARLTRGMKLVIPGNASSASMSARTKDTPPSPLPASEDKDEPFLKEEEDEPEEEVRYVHLGRIKNRLDSVPIRRKWQYLVVHHSGTREGNARYFDYYHRKVRGMENGLAYHFVIGNGVDSGDGEIEVGSRWTRQIQGGHVKGEALNEISIGVCLVGNFEETRPSKAQIIALVELVRYINQRCGRAQPEFLMHREINVRHTACPGKKFPMKELRALIKSS